MRHPREMGSEEVNAFLTHLAVEGNVSASTQNQALAALLFLYRELLERDLDLEGVIRARARRRLPVVLSEAEVRAVRRELEGYPAHDGDQLLAPRRHTDEFAAVPGTALWKTAGVRER